MTDSAPPGGSRRFGDRQRGGAVHVPAPALLVASGLAMYGGAAIAAQLFGQVGAAETAWLRTVVGAVVLVVWRRPWRERWSARRFGVAVVFGVALAVMNVAFYIAIDHLPLGTAVAIEFTGPVAVAVVTGRGWRERGAVVPAAVGVVLLAGITLDRLSHHDAVVGLVAIGIAAASWAVYIVVGRRVATAGSGVTTLSVAMSCGALVLAPGLAVPALNRIDTAGVALAAVAVGVLGSVVPYALDQVVLRRVGAASYAVLLALLPATAALVGAVALRQAPSLPELLGLACVTTAIALTGQLSGRRDGGRPDAVPEPP